MSKGNPKTDIQSTFIVNMLIHKLAENKNWLNHRVDTSIAKMDDMLLVGASVKQIAKKCKTTEASVRTHMNHLWKEHGLKCVKDDGGRFKFDVDGTIPKRASKSK